MNKLVLFFILYIFFAFNNTYASEAEKLFIKANESYRSAEYENAISLYEKIVDNGYVSKELFYNLGNAHYKMKNIPQSILFYERALKLDPSDEDIQINLQIANLQTVDKIEALPRIFFEEWFDNLLHSVPSDTFSIISLVSLWIAVACALVYIFAYNIVIKKAAFGVAAILFLAFLLNLLLATVDNNRDSEQNDAIIFSKSVYIKSSPDQSGTDLFILHEGTKVKIMDEVNHWVKIRLADGKVGWMPKNTAVRI